MLAPAANMTYRLSPMPISLDAIAMSNLERVETATIGHFRYEGFMDPRLVAVLPNVRIAGTAVTVSTVGIDSTAILAAIESIRPGDVLVIDRGGETRFACLGAVAALAMKQAGAAGAIIDGRACDFPDLRAIGFPVWCHGASPVLGRPLGLGGSVNHTICCGGVQVNPGDAILADESGILVLDPADVAPITQRGLDWQDAEATMVKRLRAGEKLTSIRASSVPAIPSG